MQKLSRPTAKSGLKAGLCLLLFLLLAQFGLPQPSTDLEQVLNQMDEAATKFRTTQANFTWVQYNKVIDDIADTQKGKIFFRRAGKDIQMAADLSEPDTKQLIFSDGKIQVYQPRIDQVDAYDASAHREEFESFLVVGFGGGGHDMLKSFAVRFDPQRGISLQQQLFETSGDYRLAKYSDIQVNQKISDNVFKLKTSAKTKVLTH